jgi:hypothetical protein
VQGFFPSGREGATPLPFPLETGLTRRLNDPAFRRRLGKVRADLFEGGMGILAAAQAAAASALVRLLKSDNESVRLGASRSVFELGAKVRESVEIEARLSALEDGRANREHFGQGRAVWRTGQHARGDCARHSGRIWLSHPTRPDCRS